MQIHDKRYCTHFGCEVTLIHEFGMIICERSVAGYTSNLCTEKCIHHESVQIAALRISKTMAEVGAKDYAPK